MKMICSTALFLGASVLSTSTAHSFVVPQAGVPVMQQSSAGQRIAAAERQIAADPKRAQSYNDLALAYLRRARETADRQYAANAQTALANGLRLAPGDFQLQKTGVALLLAEGRFPEALDTAKQLNKQVPDDVSVYGYVAAADLALGNYPDAERAAQWMLNMRPNNVPGLLVGAQLRVLFGDAAGALEFLNQAFGETPQTEPEDLAWIANQIAVVALESGETAKAAQALGRAETLFPGDPLTATNLARVRLAEAKPSEAISLLHRELEREQSAHLSQSASLLLLAQAQQSAAEPEATATFARFERSAKAECDQPTNANTALILYEAGLPGQTPRDAAYALRLAERELASRHDVATLDAYAWALYANGRYAAADEALTRALAVGVRNASFEEHAGEIALKLNRSEQAQHHLLSSVEIDPHSPAAEEARRHLGGQNPTPAAAEAKNEAKVVSIPQPPAPPLAAPAFLLQETRDTGGVPLALLIPRPTGTNRIVKKMQARVAATPADASAYAGLGAAFFQRARETGDVEDYQLAEQSLTKSLDLVSSDLPANAPLETMAEVCMGEHRFTDALDYAQKALALGSGDLSPFATVGDAYADMGEYEKASIAYSRLQPAIPAAPVEARVAYAQGSRMAYLKFISGDAAGAVQAMQVAINEGIEAHLPGENQAWLYFELGEFSYLSGQVQAAADAYLTSLTVFPGGYRALAGLGKVRASQGKYAEAIQLYQSAIAEVPMPLYVAELGDIYMKIGQPAEAEKQYKLVEYIGLLGHINQVLHNRDLALFYADHDIHLAESLALARKEFEVRSDIYTWDALAWALYKNRQYAEASESMEHALRLGTRDPMLLFHAGMIAEARGNPTEAGRQIGAALAINPHFQLLSADIARRQLDALHAQQQAGSVTAATSAGSVRNAD